MLTLFIGLSLNGFQGKYPIQNFSPQDYKAGIQNIDFAQNRDMSIFVANNLGVLSFDGNSWKTHSFKTGKKKRSLAFDEQSGRLYMGSQGEFGYFDQDWNYTTLVEQIPLDQRDFDEVWDVFILSSTVYFCTFQGIYVYDGSTINLVSHPHGLNRSFLVNGRLLTQTQNGELLELRNLRLDPGFPQTQKNQIIAGVLPQDEGFLTFYNSGIIEFSTPFGVDTTFSELSELLQGTYVNHVLQLSDTRLAISTQTGGLFLYDPLSRGIENINTDRGLQSNACLRAFQDFTGNLWVGLQNGLAVIDINSPMRSINREVGIEGSGYEAYEVDHGIYYTTSNGIYYRPKDETSCQFLAGTEGPAYGMQKINGKLYAGHHTGLFQLDNSRAIRIAVTDGLWQIKQLQSNPKYAIAGTYSGLYLFQLSDKQVLEPVEKISGFDESSRFFEEDQLGRIWVGQFYKGLFRLSFDSDFQNIQVQNISDEYDLPIKERIILSRIDNEIHIGTVAGVYKLDGASDRIVRADFFTEVVGEEEVYLMAQSANKNIHLYTENLVGFYKQISAQNYVFVPSSLYQMRNTFNNDLLNVSTHVRNCIMYNANEGFIQYVPELEERIEKSQPLLVQQVYSSSQDSLLFARMPFEDKQDYPSKLIISPKAKMLQFVVESYQFNEIGNHQFRYYLQGFDDSYTDWTSTTIKEYSNLKEGDYEFTFQTINYLGQVITSQPLSITVEPPFHRTLTAKIILAILILFGLYLLSRVQKRKYRRQTEAMELSRQQELADKQQELVQLRAEKMQSELNHVNSLLAASTMNLVVKNEFMETIKEELKQVRSRGGVNTNKALEHLVREIDTTLRVQEDWQQFEHHFNKIHGDFLNRLRARFVDLSPSEQKLCAFLRLNLNTKEIANLMGISSRGVEVARYRLRKKLHLSTGQNLSKFVLEY